MQNRNIIWGSVLAIAAMVCYVVLTFIGGDADNLASLISFISPFIAVLLIVKQTDKLQDTVNEVRRNTNGVLSQHIETVANAAAARAIEVNTIQEDNNNG